MNRHEIDYNNEGVNEAPRGARYNAASLEEESASDGPDQAFYENNQQEQPLKPVVIKGLRLTSWDDFIEEVRRVRLATAGNADLRRHGVGGETLRESMYQCLDDRYKVGFPKLFVQRSVQYWASRDTTNVKKRNARKTTTMRSTNKPSSNMLPQRAGRDAVRNPEHVLSHTAIVSLQSAHQPSCSAAFDDRDHKSAVDSDPWRHKKKELSTQDGGCVGEDARTGGEGIESDIPTEERVNEPTHEPTHQQGSRFDLSHASLPHSTNWRRRSTAQGIKQEPQPPSRRHWSTGVGVELGKGREKISPLRFAVQNAHVRTQLDLVLQSGSPEVSRALLAFRRCVLRDASVHPSGSRGTHYLDLVSVVRHGISLSLLVLLDCAAAPPRSPTSSFGTEETLFDTLFAVEPLRGKTLYANNKNGRFGNWAGLGQARSVVGTFLHDGRWVVWEVNRVDREVPILVYDPFHADEAGMISAERFTARLWIFLCERLGRPETSAHTRRVQYRKCLGSQDPGDCTFLAIHTVVARLNEDDPSVHRFGDDPSQNGSFIRSACMARLEEILLATEQGHETNLVFKLSAPASR
ncbi:hypothetical protein NX059_012276 [Plenodomus lindquistii]|nr:hypothetical protein NX059_012276 [Plenodomus lindquistii]